MQRVYIVYSPQNQAFAERLAQDLADAGLLVWLDLGTTQDIQHALETGDLVIVCLSRTAITDTQLPQTIKTIQGKHGTVIPLLVDDSLNTLQSTNEFSWLSETPIISFENRYEQAFAELLQILAAQRLPATFDNLNAANIPNPFKGLEAFQQIDSPLFFGRDDITRLAINRLRETHFLAVVGASGIGKSSLVRAGILPLIRQGAIDDSDTWVVMLFTPRTHPIEELARRLALVIPRNVDDVKTELRQSGQIVSLIDAVLQDKRPHTRLLLVIDQFEEIFTQTSEIEREQFLDILRVLSTLNNRVHVIIAIRNAYFGELSHYPDLARVFEQPNLVALGEMTTANLTQAIENPAQVVGLRYEAGLLDRLLNDTQTEAGLLPRLQYALYQLFRKRTDTRLTIAAYKTIGGVQGVIAYHADTIFNQLNKKQHDILRRLLLCLVDVNETGEVMLRQVTRDELVLFNVSDSAIQSIVNLLADAPTRLIVVQRPFAQIDTLVTIQISHETLIHAWVKLQQWIAANLEELQYEAELRRAATNWQSNEHDEGYLLRDKHLAHAEKWFKTHHATVWQKAYLEASNQLRRKEEVEARIARDLYLRQHRKRRTQWLVGLAAIVLISVVMLLIMWLSGGFRG